MHRSQCETVNNRILRMNKYWPFEFNRKFRSIRDLDRWKATEFRHFLLYYGPIVLIDVLPKSMYGNFMLFHCAIRILLSKLNENYNKFANDLLILFVKHGIKLYDQSFCVYNVHVLIHLAADVEMYGDLNNVSSFPFKNYLYKIKRLLRKSNSPLQQLINRMQEKENYNCPTIQKKIYWKRNKGKLTSLFLKNMRLCRKSKTSVSRSTNVIPIFLVSGFQMDHKWFVN